MNKRRFLKNIDPLYKKKFPAFERFINQFIIYENDNGITLSISWKDSNQFLVDYIDVIIEKYDILKNNTEDILKHLSKQYKRQLKWKKYNIFLHKRDIEYIKIELEKTKDQLKKYEKILNELYDKREKAYQQITGEMS